MLRSFASIGILSFILSSCNVNHRPLGKRDLLKYVNDPGHGLTQNTDVQGVDVRLSFEPSSLLVAQEFVAGGKKDTGLIPALEKKYSTNYYFLVWIKHPRGLYKTGLRIRR